MFMFLLIAGCFFVLLPVFSTAVVGFILTVFMSSMYTGTAEVVFLWLAYAFVLWIVYGANQKESY